MEAYLELKDILHIVELVFVSALGEVPSAIDPCQSSCSTQLTLNDLYGPSVYGHDVLC